MTAITTVVDYGVGNLHSVCRALAAVGGEVVLTSDPDVVRAAERVVLPGVGAFGDGMAELARRHLVAALTDYAASGRPLLGICLGMQLLLDVSEEFGTHRGLGLIPGRVVPVPACGRDGQSHKIPHVGWAEIYGADGGGAWELSPLADVPAGAGVYFVHSFHCVPSDPAHVLAVVDYDGCELTAAVARGNICGCQFHPEKSGPVGLGILRRFVGR